MPVLITFCLWLVSLCHIINLVVYLHRTGQHLVVAIWSILIYQGNVIFNDKFNTFYLRLYGVRHMVKDHSARGNPCPPHGLLFLSNSKGSFICTIPQTGYHIPQPFLHQSWSTGWNEKYLNGSTPWRIDPTTHRTMSERSYHGAMSPNLQKPKSILTEWQ